MDFAARITGIGSAFPENRVTNDQLAEKLAKIGVETNDQWIKERTGICERRYSSFDNPKEHNSSLGFYAATNALEMAGKTPEDIDQIIFATCSPDTLIPSTACWLQHKLGAKNAWAMDINAACSGFIYGLSTVEKFIFSGQTKTALVVGGEKLSPYLNWNDRTSCILFGDASGAAVVEAVDPESERRILSSHLLSDGSLWELLHMPAGGTKVEMTADVIENNLNKINMSGREIFKVAVRTLCEFARKTLDDAGLTIDDVNWFVPHQANIRIIEAVANRLNCPSDKIVVNVDRYGNTSSATIPTALDEAVRDGRIKKGDVVLLDAFGAGLTFGAILMRW